MGDPRAAIGAEQPNAGPRPPEPSPEQVAWAALAGVRGVGPVSFGWLLDRFGTATAVLDVAASATGLAGALASSPGDAPASSPDDVPIPLTAPVLDAIAAAARVRDRIGERVVASGLHLVTLGEPAYPSRLRAIEHPPPVLYVRGDPAALDRPRAVAIVGTRRPTGGGRTTAARIADAVASHGATVVSGLAVGIDAAAHAATVRSGLPTVAVIGGGHERACPAANRQLARGIERAGGAIASEHAPDVEPAPGTFPRRNRLISGLGDATIVVEAGIRSGALTTAAWCLGQGRSLFVLPGRPGDPAVAGSLALLREAGREATIVAGIVELLEDLGYLGTGPAAAGVAPARQVALSGLGVAERAVAAALARGAESVDRLAADTGLAPASILGVITLLELRGLVTEVYGRYRPAGALAPSTGRRCRIRVATRPPTATRH